MLFVLASNLLWFTWSIDNGVVRHDYWRMVHLIDLYDENTLTFEELLAQSNGPLKSPFTVLLPLFDGLFFDLELKGIHLAATLVRFVATALVLAAFGVWSLEKRRSLPLLLGSVAVLVVLAPALFTMLSHGQASISIIRSSFYVIFFTSLAKYLTYSRPRPLRTLLISCMLAFLILGVAGVWLPPLAGSILATVALGAALNLFDTAPKRWSVLFVLGQVFVFSLAAGLLLRGHSMGRTGTSAEAILDQPLRALRFFLSSLGNSVLTTEIARDMPDAQRSLVGIGCLALVVFGLSWSPVRTRTSSRVLGWLLIFYSLGVIGFVTVGRFVNGSPIAGRYLADSMLWQAGLLLLLSLEASSTETSKLRVYVRSVLLVAFAVSIISCQAFVAHRQWQLAPSIKKGLHRRAGVIQAASSLSEEELQRRIGEPKRIRVRYVRRAIGVMEKYKLNVFRYSAPPESNDAESSD